MSSSLPTPPRTTHKDKENKPPTPLSPSSFRTPRIVWSQENLHHAYTTQIRQLPSSSSSKGPRKSILKTSSLPLTPLMLPPETTAREITPEPADPLHHPLYLNSPVSTLVASLNPQAEVAITLIDLTEAYCVLSARLKAKAQAMLDMCGPITALEPLREHNAKLVQAFHRDIGRAFSDPQSSPPPSQDSPWATPSSVGSMKKRGFSEEEVKRARDLCNLSHAAMRCFSNISVVPVLCSIFTDAQLGEILTDVLAIPLAVSLPTPNARKTCQIAIWTLQIQRLPIAVLAPAADRIAYALRRGIDGELGREGKQGAASDGLKAISTLVTFQPELFITPFASIFPSVLANLTSQNLGLRAQAAIAMLSLSHAVAHFSAPSTTLASLAQATSSYISGQHQSRKSSKDLSPITEAFSLCLNAATPAHVAQAPMWALSVISALIVLSGGEALTHARTLKLILGHVQTAMAIKRTTVRATAGLVWRALIWACVQLDNGEEVEEMKESGWKVVCQIVDGAIGISLVAALLGQSDTREKRVHRALGVVSAMIKKGGKTCEEAVDVLERLLCGVGHSIVERQERTWVDHRLLAEPLFDATLLRVELKLLAFHVKDGLNKSVTVKEIRRLREEEVTQHWDALFAIWKEAVQRAPLGEDGDVPSPLLNAWQSLLLIQAQLSQGYEHLTSEPVFISTLTDLLKTFVTDQSLEWSLEANAPSWASQPLKLGFVRNLWIVTRNVFTLPTLTNAAETLLREVLSHEYYLEQNEVHDAWARLCAELLLSCTPELIKELWDGGQEFHRLESEMNRALWRTACLQWVSEVGHWNGAVELLRAHFRLPVMPDYEEDDIDLWIHLLECTILTAAARKVSINTILDAVAYGIDIGRNLACLFTVLPPLLGRVDVSVVERLPALQLPSKLFELANDTLVAGYPPEDPSQTPLFFNVLRSLADNVQTACKELLVDVLGLIQNGVKVLIEDEHKVFTDTGYNQQVISFYTTALDTLKAIPPTSQTLHTLAPLFASAFNRIPEPAIGPSAFKRFWVEIYSPMNDPNPVYPEELKPILRNVQEVMCAEGEVLAPGLSPETQAFADLTFTTVPDSQAGQVVTSTDPEGQPPLIFDIVPEDLKGVEAEHQTSSSEPRRITVTGEKELSLDSPIQGFSTSPLVSGLPKEAPTEDITFDLTESLCAQIAPSKKADNLMQRYPTELPLIKRESEDFDPDIAMVMSSSQMANSLRSPVSVLGKRRRSRFAPHLSKKHKSALPAGTELINISDDEDSDQVSLDLSIVVSRIKPKNPSILTEDVFGPTSIPKHTTPKTTLGGHKKRKFFEAVEIPRLAIRYSPRKRTGSARDIHSREGEAQILAETSDPQKCHHSSVQSLKAESIEDWSDASPSRGIFELGSDDADVLETPQQPSDASIPQSRPGQISARHIISPLPRRSPAESYDPPSDDVPMSSSPLKQVAARRLLRRARTAPAVTTTSQSDASDPSPVRPVASRRPSEEYLTLEHAHVVVTSGASNMGLQELMAASRMAHGISAALSDQMTKKLSSPP